MQKYIFKKLWATPRNFQCLLLMALCPGIALGIAWIFIYITWVGLNPSGCMKVEVLTYSIISLALDTEILWHILFEEYVMFTVIVYYGAYMLYFGEQYKLQTPNSDWIRSLWELVIFTFTVNLELALWFSKYTKPHHEN